MNAGYELNVNQWSKSALHAFRCTGELLGITHRSRFSSTCGHGDWPSAACPLSCNEGRCSLALAEHFSCATSLGSLVPSAWVTEQIRLESWDDWSVTHDEGQRKRFMVGILFMDVMVVPCVRVVGDLLFPFIWSFWPQGCCIQPSVHDT